MHVCTFILRLIFTFQQYIKIKPGVVFVVVCQYLPSLTAPRQWSWELLLNEYLNYSAKEPFLGNFVNDFPFVDTVWCKMSVNCWNWKSLLGSCCNVLEKPMVYLVQTLKWCTKFGEIIFVLNGGDYGP